MKNIYPLIVMIISIMGCSSLTQESIINSPTPIHQTTSFPITSIPKDTSTFTITPIAIPTLTTLPTIPSSNGIEQLEIWFSGVTDCFLPCWAGLTPEVSDWASTKQLIESMSSFSTIRISENTNCDFGKCNGIGWSLFPQSLASGAFYVALPENKLHMMVFDIQDTGTPSNKLLDRVNLTNLLGRYGEPSTIIFFSEPDLPGQIFLEETLIYPKHHFVIRYSMYAKRENNMVVSCNQISYVTLIILANRNILNSIDTIVSPAETKNLYIGNGHKTVEEAMSITTREFYELYSKEDAPCIIVPISLWLP